MRAEIKKLSEAKEFSAWAETAELSQDQLKTHMLAGYMLPHSYLSHTT